jgi:hypothetical protein
MMKDFDDWMKQTYDYVDDITEVGFCYGDMSDAYYATNKELLRLRAFAKDVVQSPEMAVFYLFKHGVIDENGKPI